MHGLTLYTANHIILISSSVLGPTLLFPFSLLYIYNVACQAHPALVEIGLVLARLFHFYGLLVRICLVKARPGAMAALRRPGPSGTQQ